MKSSPKIQVQVPDEDYWRKQVKCQEACPVHTDARGYVRAIAEGDFEGAYLIARGPNPLASICGRVCGAPCEAACRRGDIDQSVSIRALKRFVTSEYGTESSRFDPMELLKRALSKKRECGASEELQSLQKVMKKLDTSVKNDGPKIAIIGSGPAGLGAAHDLALLGMQPVVFEMEPVPAGMLAVGIPSYRLPRELIQAEVELIKALGVRFECNVQVGKDISFEKIREDYAATIIAVGAKKSRILPLPGSDSLGVLGGVEFLRDVALGRPVALGKKVVVIGGGNVAYDVSRSVVRQISIDISRSAIRQGVGEVHLVSLESLDELPADNLEITEGDEEGVIRHHRLGPNRIIADNSGCVKAIEFKRVLRVFDENRRFSPQFDNDQLEIIEADTVIWSIGQSPDLSFVPEDGDLPRNQRGFIDCNQDDLTTSAPDVFLAGDIAYGPKLLIHAVASGKQVARSVYEYLTHHKLESKQTMYHLPILNYKRELDYEKIPRLEVPTIHANERKNSQTKVVEAGYNTGQATCEASRCLDCGVNTIFDSDKCILCGGCADVCPELCLRLVSISSLEHGEVLDQAIDTRFGDTGNEQSAIIKDETRCTRCALCATRCPVGAITMERMNFEHQWTETV